LCYTFFIIKKKGAAAMIQKLNPEDTAAKRMQLITPLLDPSLDSQKIIELKKQICYRENISYRTISRYLDAYRSEGFQGLKPKVSYHQKESRLPPDFPELLEEAIVLRRECPSRSILDIIRILELEERVRPGVLCRSTLQRHMQARGFGNRQMKMYTKQGTASRRFQKQHRCDLYQGDIKYGPYLPIGKDGAPKQVYLSVFIDDATRYIVAAKFYDNQRVEIIEDTLRLAVMRYGKPSAIYVDNGKQYRSEWLTKACNRLDIRLCHAKPYHPEGKGKVEAFNRRMDSFLSEIALEKPQSLEELNRLLDVWITEHYHKSIHHSLNGISPETAFRTDSRPLKFVSAKDCAEAFLHTEEREVDKTGCLSFGGKKYEAGMKLAGRKVEVYFDPTWTDEVEIHYKGMEPFKANVLAIGEHCGVRRELPEDLQPLTTDHSRMLAGLNQANITNRTRTAVATTFRRQGKEAADHV
jgi:transposase InsO family protein